MSLFLIWFSILTGLYGVYGCVNIGMDLFKLSKTKTEDVSEVIDISDMHAEESPVSVKESNGEIKFGSMSVESQDADIAPAAPDIPIAPLASADPVTETQTEEPSGSGGTEMARQVQEVLSQMPPAPVEYQEQMLTPEIIALLSEPFSASSNIKTTYVNI